VVPARVLVQDLERKQLLVMDVVARVFSSCNRVLSASSKFAVSVVVKVR
jgi:hypothetical protein